MKLKTIVGRLVVVAWLGSLLVVSPAFSHDHHPKGAPVPEPKDVEAKAVTIKLADLDLLDQDGKRVKFKSDVVKDRLVAIDLIYTTCPVVCPILSATFANVQNALKDRLEKEVVLISLSVDPVTDIPARLKEYAEKWEAKPGWTFLTGDKRNVEQVLRGLGAYTANFVDHPVMFLVGDAARGDWTRFYGFASPDQILAKIEALGAQRQSKSQAGSRSR